LESAFLLITACVFIAFLWGMRRGAVRGGAVALWIVICSAMVSVPLLESRYLALAQFMGISYARDMLNMFAILFLLIYVFYLTSKLQQASDTVEILLARVAIAEHRLGALAFNSAENCISRSNGSLFESDVSGPCLSGERKW